MGRRVAQVLAVAALAAACRPDTVSLAGEPAVGTTIRIRYEIDAEVTRSVEGQAPETTVLATRLDTEQVVLDVDEQGTLVALILRVDGGAPRRVQVRLDRAGSLAAIDEVEGLPASALGLPPATLGTASGRLALPERPVAIGDEWAIDDGAVRGRGRLVGLGVADGIELATVRSELLQVIDEVATVGPSDVALVGRVRSTSTTRHDLADGTIRRATRHTRGVFDALVQPPAGVDALPVPAVITYDIRVRATRLG